MAEAGAAEAAQGALAAQVLQLPHMPEPSQLQRAAAEAPCQTTWVRLLLLRIGSVHGITHLRARTEMRGSGALVAQPAPAPAPAPAQS